MIIIPHGDFVRLHRGGFGCMGGLIIHQLPGLRALVLQVLRHCAPKLMIGIWKNGTREGN